MAVAVGCPPEAVPYVVPAEDDVVPVSLLVLDVLGDEVLVVELLVPDEVDDELVDVELDEDVDVVDVVVVAQVDVLPEAPESEEPADELVAGDDAAFGESEPDEGSDTHGAELPEDDGDVEVDVDVGLLDDSVVVVVVTVTGGGGGTLWSPSPSPPAGRPK